MAGSVQSLALLAGLALLACAGRSENRAGSLGSAGAAGSSPLASAGSTQLDAGREPDASSALDSGTALDAGGPRCPLARGYPSCAVSCGSNQPSNFVEEECVDGGWVCPAGTVGESFDCPERSCANPSIWCCYPQTGKLLDDSQCGTDGLIHCAADAIETLDTCIPSYLPLSDCTTIKGTPCSNAGDGCTSPNMSCMCTTASSAGGPLTWVCAPPISPP